MNKSILCLVVLTLTACGSSSESPTPIPVGGVDSAPVIVVQLNDKFNERFPSESIQLTDARYFTPPSIIHVVQGSYCGGVPGQYLHARLRVGNASMCEYQANNIRANALTLQACYGGLGPVNYLPPGTMIELQNYDAPGMLLEVEFNLVR